MYLTWLKTLQFLINCPLLNKAKKVDNIQYLLNSSVETDKYEKINHSCEIGDDTVEILDELRKPEWQELNVNSQ